MVATPRRHFDAIALMFAAGGAVAISLILPVHLDRLGLPFDAEPHAWGSAHFATIARSYAEQGFLALHGLPIGNNPPLGREPDAYVHWPPVFGMLLGVVFKAFGVGERVARGFMLVIGLGLVAATAWVAKLELGARGAAAAAFAVLTLPVFAGYVALVQLTTLGIVLMLVALAAFLKATSGGRVRTSWAAFGAATQMLAVMTSWEPAVLPLGLLLAAWLARDRMRARLGLVYLGAGILGGVAVFAFFLTALPSLGPDLLATALYRMGLGAYRTPEHASIHSLVNAGYARFHPTLPQLLLLLAEQLWQGIGLFYLAAAVVVVFLGFRRGVRGGAQVPAAFVALAACAGLWFLGMLNQSTDNDFETLVALPAFALGFATLVNLVANRGSGGRTARGPGLTPALLAAFLVLPLAPFARATWEGHPVPPPTGMLDYAAGIRDHTEPDAVVLTPLPSMVPVYYSRRHLIRGIDHVEALTAALGRVGTDFPGSPVYLAMPPSSSNSVPETLARNRVAAGDGRVLLFRLR